MEEEGEREGWERSSGGGEKRREVNCVECMGREGKLGREGEYSGERGMAGREGRSGSK